MAVQDKRPGSAPEQDAPERVQTEDVYYVVQVVNSTLVVHSEADSAEGGARVASTVGGFVVSGKRRKSDD